MIALFLVGVIVGAAVGIAKIAARRQKERTDRF